MIRSLLYPLGLVANILFFSRFFIQWLQSEKKQRSHVTSTFWIISLIANMVLCLHAFIQLQYPVCLIQSLNGVIAWRNLNLLRGSNAKSFKTTVLTLIGVALGVTLLFFLQGFSWMRSPSLPWSESQTENLSFLWHLIGFGAMVLFASRFWVQWWLAEKHQKSHLGRSFWWTSLAGGTLSLLYFVRLNDLVNILGYGVGIIPYIRNLMLMRKKDPLNTEKKNESLFLFAGEQSGDLLGGKLIEALKTSHPSLRLFGVGGPQMRSIGMECSLPMEQFQVMGFSDVIKSLPRLWNHFRSIKKQILREQPKGVILIDYPEFNMRLAKALRKGGYKGKLIHYVCPSVWAWRKHRVYDLANTLDRLLSILPFEKDCFKKTSLNVSYIGHPLVAAIDNYSYDENWCISEKPVIALFPGSRRHEIELNLPLQLKTVEPLMDKYAIAVSVARPELEECIQKYVKNVILVPNHQRYELMKAAKAALATSGTVVLELGLHATPTVVTYQLQTFNYLLGRYAFRIILPYYTLVNIICRKEVFPEFIHKNLSTEAILDKLQTFLRDGSICRQECQRLREILNEQDASQEAAKVIINDLQYG